MKVVEVVRLATDGVRNGCSFLYGACVRAARALGYERVITYTLAREGGASLRASGFEPAARVRARAWACESRPRPIQSAMFEGVVHDVTGEEKVRWERSLA